MDRLRSLFGELGFDQMRSLWHLNDGRPGASYGLIEQSFEVPAMTRIWHTTAKTLANAQECES